MAKRMTFLRMILPKPLRDLMRLLEILTKYINGGIRTTKKKRLQPPPSIFLMKSPQSLNPFLHFLAQLGTNDFLTKQPRFTHPPPNKIPLPRVSLMYFPPPFSAPRARPAATEKPKTFQANTSDCEWLKLTRKESHQCYIIPFEEFTIIRYSKKTARFCRR